MNTATETYTNDLTKIQVPTTTHAQRAAILRTIAPNDLLDLAKLPADVLAKVLDLMNQVGEIVTLDAEGFTQTGILTSVYFTDGIAVNIRGLDGVSFSCGPVYGATLRVGTAPAVTRAMIARHRAL